jgi:RNA polymerase sigma factor (sigma-70 family)
MPIIIDLESEIAALTLNERTAVELHCFAGATREEIAEVLGVTRKCVNRSLSRAVKKIKENLLGTITE